MKPEDEKTEELLRTRKYVLDSVVDALKEIDKELIYAGIEPQNFGYRPMSAASFNPKIDFDGHSSSMRKYSGFDMAADESVEIAAIGDSISAVSYGVHWSTTIKKTEFGPMTTMFPDERPRFPEQPRPSSPVKKPPEPQSEDGQKYHQIRVAIAQLGGGWLDDPLEMVEYMQKEFDKLEALKK